MLREKVKFEVRDRHGRRVRLRESVYDQHLPDRPEMARYLEEAERTVREPHYELQDGGSVCYLRHGYGQRGTLYLRVPVYYKGDRGEVATFHLTARKGRGEETWKMTGAP